MKKKTGRTRTLYSPEFKAQAIKLAQELGSTRQAADKLGMKNFQTLTIWRREARTKTQTPSYDELHRLKEENKKIKRELEKERKSTAILKDAMAFFCKESHNK